MWTANLFLYRDMSVYLQEPHLKRRAGQSFSNCGLKITYIVWEWTSSLSGSVNRRINRGWKRFSLSNMQRRKGSKRIEMIIKMVNEFKLTVVHFARPNSMQICACAWSYRWTKKLWKTGLGHRAAGPPLAAGPSGRRAAGRGPAFSKTHFSDISIRRPNTCLSRKGTCVGGDKKPKYLLWAPALD